MFALLSCSLLHTSLGRYSSMPDGLFVLFYFRSGVCVFISPLSSPGVTREREKEDPII